MMAVLGAQLPFTIFVSEGGLSSSSEDWVAVFEEEETTGGGTAFVEEDVAEFAVAEEEDEVPDSLEFTVVLEELDSSSSMTTT